MALNDLKNYIRESNKPKEQSDIASRMTTASGRTAPPQISYTDGRTGKNVTAVLDTSTGRYVNLKAMRGVTEPEYKRSTEVFQRDRGEFESSSDYKAAMAKASDLSSAQAAKLDQQRRRSEQIRSNPTGVINSLSTDYNNVVDAYNEGRMDEAFAAERMQTLGRQSRDIAAQMRMNGIDESQNQDTFNYLRGISRDATAFHNAVNKPASDKPADTHSVAPVYAMLSTLSSEDEINEYLNSIGASALASDRKELSELVEHNRGQSRTVQQINIMNSAMSDDYKIQAIAAYDPALAQKLYDMSADERKEEYRRQYQYGLMSLDEYDEALAKAEQNFYSYYTDHYDPSDPESVAEYEKLNAEHTWLLDNKDKAWTRSNDLKYAAVTKNEDFAKKSATDYSNRDPMYMYINNIGGVQDKEESKDVYLRYGEGAASSPNPSAGLYEKYKNMTDEEVAMYNYLYKTKGKEAAEEYLTFAEYAMNARAVEATKEAAAQEATEHLGAASGKSTISSLVSGIGYLDAAVQKAGQVGKELFGGGISAPVDYNTESMRPSVYASTVLQVGAENLNKKYGMISSNEEDRGKPGVFFIDEKKNPLMARILNGQGWGYVYQSGMSTLNSWAGAGLSFLVPSLGLFTLASSAATNEMLNTVEKGGSDTQALAMGFFAGFAEFIMEKIPMDNLLYGDWTGNKLGSFIRQTLPEGLEEGGTSIINWAADAIIMARDSDYSQKVDAYIANGMDEKTAKQRAFWDKVIEIGWDVAGGIAMGSTSGTVRLGLQTVVDAKNIGTLKKSASLDTYRAITPDLVTRVLAENPNDKIALAIKAQKDAGGIESVKANDIYRLMLKNGDTVNQMLPSAAQVIQESAAIVEKAEAMPVSVTRSAIDQVKAGTATNKTFEKILDAAKADPAIQAELKSLGVDITSVGGMTTAQKRAAVKTAIEGVAAQESESEAKAAAEAKAKADIAAEEIVQATAAQTEAEPAAANATPTETASATAPVSTESPYSQSTQIAINAQRAGDSNRVGAFISQAVKSPAIMAELGVQSTGNNQKDRTAIKKRITELAAMPATSAPTTTATATTAKAAPVRDRIAELASKPAAAETSAPALESRADFTKSYRATHANATEAEINAAYELKASEITRDGQTVTADGKDLTFSQFREAIIEIAKANGHPVAEGMIVDMFDSAYKTQKHKAELQEAADTVNKRLAKDNIGVTVRISYSNIEFPEVDGVQGNALFNSAKNEIVFNGKVVSVHDILSKRFGHEIFHPGANVDPKLVQQTLDVFKKLYKAGKLTGEAKRLAKNMNAEITERVRCYQLYENAIAKQEGREARNISDEDAKVELAADLFGAAFDHTSLAKEIAGEKPEVITGWRKGVQRLVKMLGIKPNTRNSVEAEMNKILEQITKALNEAAPEDKGVNRSVETKTIRGLKYEKAYGQYVAPIVAEIMNSDKYAPPPDYMSQYSVSTTQPWKENYLRVNKGPIAQMVVDAIEKFTDAMIQDDVIRGYVPMGEYKYSTMGPLRTNQEYVWTFDMDTSCPRTFQFLFYRDAIQKEAGRYLTYNESINLLELMRAYGQNIPCCYCYVENKRVLLSASYNNFFKFRNDVLTSATKEEAAKVMYGYKKGKPLPEASQKALDRWWEGRSYNPSLTDVWTATNTARNSVLNFLDKELAEGRISTEENKTTKNTVVTERESKLNQRAAERFDVTDKSAKKELESFVKDWLYDTNAGIPHIYNTDNDTSVSKVDERALALNREALAYAKSASCAKSVENYVPYTDQLKNVSEKDRAYILGMGGIRKHSSNDFRMDYVQDYFLFYADLAAGEWTGQTYTKSIDFAKIFACTNDRINLSIAFYEDKDGNITPNIQEGAPHDDVRALRNAYKNVGAMAMVTSDNQLTHALNSEWIDMIIPFHASGLDKAVWYNLRMWNDYTSKQGERFYNATTMKNKLKAAGVAIPKGAKAAKVKELYDDHFKTKRIYDDDGNAIKPHFFPGDTYVKGHKIPGHHNDVNRYFQLCEEYGVHPRFYGTTVRDTNGKEMDVTEHPSYIKLIKETSRTDTPQEAIEFNFGNYDEFLKMAPFEYAMTRLKEEAKNGGFDNMRDDSYGIVKEFIKEYLDKDRPLGYLTERAKATSEALAEASNEESDAQFKSVSDLYRSVSVVPEKKKTAGNVGYHAGDLGKSEHLGMISGSRDTGHFGFGTYFVGDRKKIDGYNRRNGQEAPVETVDFSQYNLYRPATNDDGFTLHNFLRSLNAYYDRDPNLVQTPEEYEQAKENIDDYRYEVEELENTELEEQLIGVAESVLGKYGVAEVVQRKMPVDAWLDSDGTLELTDGTRLDIMDAVNMVEDVRAVNIALYDEVANRWTESAVYRYDGWRHQVQRDSEDLFNLTPAEVDAIVAEIRDEIAAGNYNWEAAKGQDSASTRFMKKLGYEGIDVRHLSQMDNTTYGSVIYDLKGDDLARKNEIGTAKYSLSSVTPAKDKAYLDAVNRNDMETAQRMVDKASKAAGFDTDAYHGTNQGDFTEFDWGATQRADGGFYGRGHYFTKYENVAKQYGNRIVRAKLRLGKTFVWSDEVNSYQGKKPPELFSSNIVSRINMAKLFPDIFANKTMSYWEYDARKGDNVEKTIRWGDLDRIVKEISNGLSLRHFVDGTYRWFTEGRFWDVPVGEQYSSVEAANDGKIFAAINALREKYDGVFSSMSFDDQTSYVQDYGTEVTEALKAKGYTSAMDTPEGEEIVVFDSAQIKSADPVTYDDNGNVIPLSERFNVGNTDIRYSLTESKFVSELVTLLAKGEARAKYWKPRLSAIGWDLVQGAIYTSKGDGKHFLDEYSKWVYSNKNGHAVFAIYSITNFEDPTILYACELYEAERCGYKLSILEGTYAGNGRDFVFDSALSSKIEPEQNRGGVVVHRAGNRTANDRDVPLPKRQRNGVEARDSRQGEGDYEDLSARSNLDLATEIKKLQKQLKGNRVSPERKKAINKRIRQLRSVINGRDYRFGADGLKKWYSVSADMKQKSEEAVAQATASESPTAEDIGSVAQTGDPVGTVIYHKDEVSEIARAVANDEALSALLAQYGVIPQTGSYYREAKVPRRTEAKNRVSKTAVTVMGAEATPESRIPTIKQAIVDGKMSYAPTTNQRDLQAAKRTIYRDGWDAAMSDWTAKVRSGRASSKLVALGATFLDNMDGDEFTGEQYVDVLMDYAQLLRNAGQVVQAAKILKNLTPAGKLYGIQRQINKYNEHGQLPPIEGWIDGASDYLSSRLERLVKVRPENMRADDEARLVVKILYDFAKDSLPKNIREANRAKAKERRDQLVMDRIQSLFDNKEEYTRLWNATKEKFVETMGETPIDYVDFDRMMEDLSHYTTRLLADAKFGGLALDPKLAEAFLGAKTDADRDAILEMIYADLASQVKATGMEKFTAYRYLGMLGNFRTQVRNIFGNLFFQVPRMASETLQGTIEALMHKAGIISERTTSALYDMDTFKFAFEDFKNVREIILSGGKYRDVANDDLMQNLEKYRTIFKNKVFEGYRKATNWAMDQGDAAFCSFTYADSLARFMKANGTTWAEASEELRDKARLKAVKDAAEATYRDNNQFAEFVSRLGKPRDPNNRAEKAFSILLQGVLSFRKTPANILVRTYEYSPASLITGTVKAIQKANGNEDVSGTDIVRIFSQAITGTGLMVLGAWMASMGNLIGKAPEDDKERELWEMQGYQEYSLVVGDTSYTLDWLAPECIPLFLGANLHQASLENGLTLAETLKALSSLTDPILSMSMLQGVNDALENATTYGDDAALTRFTGNALWSYVTQPIPTILGQFERGMESYRMSTYVESGAELPAVKKLVGKLSAKIPGWDSAQIVYTDAWGRMQENPQSRTLNFIYQMFSPGYVSTIRTTDAEQELLRLYEATGESSVLISSAAKYFNVDGEKKNLTGDEYYSYNVMRGQTALAVVSALTSSPGYAVLDDKARVKAVEKAYDYATQIAKYDLTAGAYVPDKWVLNTRAASEETGLPVSTVVFYRCIMSAEEENNTSKDARNNVRAAIAADTTMTVEQKNALDNVVVSDGVYLVQDKDVDYSSPETFVITQMSDGAQKHWTQVKNQFHISAEQYQEAWAIYQNDDLKAAEKKARLARIVGSTQRGNLLYSVLGKKLDDK